MYLPFLLYTEGDGDDDDDGEYKGPIMEAMEEASTKAAAAAAPGEAPPRPSRLSRAPSTKDGAAAGFGGLSVQLNMGEQGIEPLAAVGESSPNKDADSPMSIGGASRKNVEVKPEAAAPAGAPAPAPAADDDNESFKPEKHGDDFVTRRLSVINPFDAGEAAEGGGEEKAGEGF